MRAGNLRTIVMGLGLLSSLTAVPLGARLWRTVHAVPVATCQVRHSHMYYFELALSDGTLLVLNSQDLPGRRDCLAAGTVIEKTRWHLGWTLDGAYVEPDDTSMWAWGIIAMACIIGLIASGRLWLRARREEQ